MQFFGISSISPVFLHFVHKLHRFVIVTTCMMDNDGQWDVLGWWWGGRGRRYWSREGELALALVVQALVEVVHRNPC